MGKKSIARKTPTVRMFISEEAEGKYETVILKKSLYAEKGFLLKDTPTMGYTLPIFSVIN